MSIDTLIKKHHLDLNSYKQTKDNYYRDCMKYDNPNYDENLATNSFDAICEKFEALIHISAREAKVKENGQTYWASSKEVIPKAAVVMEDTKIDITLGLFRDFYIITKLENTNNLYSMKDEFWNLLLKLTELGKFNYREEHKHPSHVSKKYPRFFNKQGNINKIMRDYFINQTEYGSCHRLGTISVNWDMNTAIDILIINYIEAFKIMYKLNYLLWSEENRISKKLEFTT